MDLNKQVVCFYSPGFMSSKEKHQTKNKFLWQLD